MNGFTSCNPMNDLLCITNDQINEIIKEHYLDLQVPLFSTSRDLSKADLSAVMSPVAAQLKVDPL